MTVGSRMGAQLSYKEAGHEYHVTHSLGAIVRLHNPTRSSGPSTSLLGGRASSRSSRYAALRDHVGDFDLCNIFDIT